MKTTKAILPLGEKRRWWGAVNKNSIPVIHADQPLSTTATGRLFAHYAAIQQSVTGEVRCRWCGARTLSKLMKQDDGLLVCQACCVGGSGDSFVGTGQWLAPSKGEIRRAVSEDRAA